MNYFIIFSITIGIIFFAFGLFIMVRNNAVFRFRTMLIGQCASYNKSLDIRQYAEKNAFNIYDSMPSYHKMVWSFKPLRPVYWLSKEDYDTLFPETTITE